MFLAVFAAQALAEVENTHHDMRRYDVGSEKSVCAYCHVPHSAASDRKLFAQTTAFEDKLGLVGAFCYSCHDGTVVPTALIQNADGLIGLEVLTKSHGLTLSALSQRTGGLEGEKNLIGSGLVSINPATGALPSRMECTACHSPHNNKYPPFLVAPLATLCGKCHSGSDQLGKGRMTKPLDTGAGNGAHPVGMEIAYSGTERKWPEKKLMEMSFGPVDPKLVIPTPSPADLTRTEVHWNLGGHLDFTSEDPAMPGKVGCSTCHSAHSTRANLLILDAIDEAGGRDPLCNGCHGKDKARVNPGGTAFYHPAENESDALWMTSTTPSRKLSIAMPPAWPKGAKGELLCMTCHRAHRAKQGTLCMRDAGDGKKYVCDSCHLPEEDITPANSHHYSTLTDKSAFLKGRELGWYKAKGEPGDLSDGLTCIDCHTKLARDAHNW